MALENFLKFFRWKNSRSNLVLDIGAETVKALFWKDNNGRVEILGYGRSGRNDSNLQYGNIINKNGVINACREAISGVSFSENKKFSLNSRNFFKGGLTIGIAGGFVKGRGSVLRLVREDARAKIGEAELKNIFSKVHQKTLELLRSQIFEEGMGADVQLLSAVLQDVKIDGYRVVNPLGFKGREIFLNVYETYSSGQDHKIFQDIGKELGFRDIMVIDESFALASVLKNTPGDDSRIFVDIGRETTSVAVVDKGVIIFTSSFNLGGKIFTRRLSQEFGVSFPEAEGIKRRYENGKLSPAVLLGIEKSLERDVRLWVTALASVLQDITSREVLPNFFYLSGGGSFLPDIARLLEKGKWGSGLPFVGSRKVTVFNEDEIRELFAPAGKVKIDDPRHFLVGPDDIMPAALGAATLRLGDKKDEIQRLLFRTMRIVNV